MGVDEMSLQSTQNSTLSPGGGGTTQCYAQRDASIPAARALDSYASTACESSNYVCNSTTFAQSGQAAPNKGAELQCASVSGLGQVCMNVDTAVAVKASGSSKTVYHCSNAQVLGSNGYAFQAYSDTLEGALSSVYTQCQSRSPRS